MKVLMGSCLALLLAGAAPALAGDNGAPQGYQDSDMQDVGSQTGEQAGSAGAHSERQQARHDQRRAERRAARHNQQQAGDGQQQQTGERQHARRAQHGQHQQAGQRHSRTFAMGDRVPQRLLAGKRVITNYKHFRVEAPAGGDRWVKARSQILLVSADGRVKMAMERHRRGNNGAGHQRRARGAQVQQQGYSDQSQDQSYPDSQ